MVFIVIPYIPDGPVTKAIKKRLKTQGLSYKLGYLGELMDENYTEAIKRNHLIYRAEHLKKLKHVEQNPQVVDIAFEVLEDELKTKNIQLPTINEERIPYYPNYGAILLYTALNTIVLTVAITAIVLLLQQSIALMTTLIVIASILGAAAFIYTLSECVIYVDISQGSVQK